MRVLNRSGVWIILYNTHTISKGVSCRVLQCRNEDMFVKICEKLGVTKFTNGTNPNYTLWKRLNNTSRIITSGHEVELDKTGMCEGMFDDAEATVLQYAHSLHF